MLTPDQKRRLKGLLRHGLPRIHRPWAALAAQLDASETDVLAQAQQWLADGTIKRMGLVVNHHALGYRHNAMVVFNVPD
ncbi:MAG: Lrp/AsnC family transcriptional regulator, partial [Gammaproteobacteria bacterium]